MDTPRKIDPAIDLTDDHRKAAAWCCRLPENATWEQIEPALVAKDHRANEIGAEEPSALLQADSRSLLLDYDEMLELYRREHQAQ